MKRFALLLGSLLVIIGFVFFFVDAPFKYLLQANTYLTSGKVAKAVKLLKGGYKKHPNNTKLGYALAKAYLLAGETELANKVILSNKKITETLKCNTNFRDFLVDLSDANHNLGNKRFARFFAIQYLECHKNPEPSQQTVKNLLQIGQILPEKSIELWEESFNIANTIEAPELKESIKALLLPKYFQIAEDLRKQKNYKDAFETLSRARVLGKSAEVNYEQAKVSIELGKFDQAQKLFEDTIQLEPENDDYKIAYANALKKMALNTKDIVKRNEYFEKIKLLLTGDDDPVKASLLKKIINLNAKYKITNSKLELKRIEDYLYPTLLFKIEPVSDIKIKKYKVVFFDSQKKELLDEYETTLTNDELNQIIEVTCKSPIENGTLINAKIFINDELIKEYTNK